MKQFGRRFVASATAAGVLLCSIYCACGDVGRSGRDSAPGCHATAFVATNGLSSHCHGPPHSAADDDGENGGKLPTHGGGHHGAGCGHCDATLAKVDPNTSKVEWPAPAATDFVPCVVATFCTQTASHVPSCCGDLPPPPGQPTLLSLHCALNT